MKITFINEIADLCEQIGANVQKVAKGIGMDKRIGDKFLHAGPGYGGSCFPKDTLALVKTAQDFDSPVRLIETTVAINDKRKRAMGRKVIAACGGNVRGKKIAILGLTFKPNTDDMRDAPSITIIQALLDGGANSPRLRSRRAWTHGEGRWSDPSPTARIPTRSPKDADALVIVTEWDEFRALDFKRLKTADEQADRSSTCATSIRSRKSSGMVSATSRSARRADSRNALHSGSPWANRQPVRRIFHRSSDAGTRSPERKAPAGFRNRAWQAPWHVPRFRPFGNDADTQGLGNFDDRLDDPALLVGGVDVDFVDKLPVDLEPRRPQPHKPNQGGMARAEIVDL